MIYLCGIFWKQGFSSSYQLPIQKLTLNRKSKRHMERLIFYLDSETDNMKRIRTLNLIHIEIETVKSLEVSYGAKKDVLKIVYSDKVLSFLQKELELIHKELEFPRYFIKIETSWQSPLYLTDETYLIEIIEMVSGLFLSKRVVTHNGAESPLTEIGRAFLMFNLKMKQNVYRQ